MKDVKKINFVSFLNNSSINLGITVKKGMNPHNIYKFNPLFKKKIMYTKRHFLDKKLKYLKKFSYNLE